MLLALPTWTSTSGDDASPTLRLPQRAGRPDVRTKKNHDPKVREAILVQRGQAKAAREKAAQDFARTNGAAGARLHQRSGNLPSTPLNPKLPFTSNAEVNRSGVKGEPVSPPASRSTSPAEQPKKVAQP